MRFPSLSISSLVLLAATTTTTTTTAFTSLPRIQRQKTFLNAAEIKSSTSTSSWDEYKHKNIDPSLEKVNHHSQGLHGPDVSESKRLEADQYWSKVSMEEKQRLRDLNKKDPWWIGMKTSKSSWDSYAKAAIDPSTQKEDHHSQHLHGPEVSKSVRDESDQFWLRQLEEEKESLHKMNDPWKDSSERRLPAITTPLDQYQQLNLDRRFDEDHHDAVASSKIDSEVRQKSDEFWLQSYLEEQSKLHEHSDDVQKVVQEEESPYEKYTHTNLDGIMEDDDHHKYDVAYSKIDPDVRAKSDEFWLQSFLEEKSKLQSKKKKASP